MSTKPASLVFWMLLHIHTDPTILIQIRAEIAPFVLITQPHQILSIPSPPRLSINLSALEKSCPLLKSCLYETLRLYANPTPTRFVAKDTIIREPKPTVRSHQDYLLEEGSYITAPLTLLHHNPAYFWQPHEFQPRRFITISENNDPINHKTDLNENHPSPLHLHPYGLPPSTCPARAYAEAEILAFTAAIISLWDFSPANPDKGWNIPNPTEREVVSVPSRDVRVKVRARELSS